jgi:hypothetical protein
LAIALSVAFTPTPTAAATLILIETSPQMSAGITFCRRSLYKFTQVSTVAQASPMNILAAYNALYGALVSGKRIFVRSTPITTSGVRGTPYVQTIVIT